MNAAAVDAVVLVRAAVKLQSHIHTLECTHKAPPQNAARRVTCLYNVRTTFIIEKKNRPASSPSSTVRPLGRTCWSTCMPIGCTATTRCVRIHICICVCICIYCICEHKQTTHTRSSWGKKQETPRTTDHLRSNDPVQQSTHPLPSIHHYTQNQTKQ